MAQEENNTNTNNPTNNANISSKPQIIKRGGVGFFTAFLMSSVACVGGAYLALFANANPQLMSKIGASKLLPQANGVMTKAQGDNLAAIEADITRLNARIDALSGTPAAGANAAPNNLAQAPTPSPAAQANAIIDLSPMRAEINGLSGRLTAIETRLAALDPTGTGGAIIAQLQAEIATLKVNVADLTTKISQTPSPAVTFAVISLAEAANRNGGFVPEFAAVRAALPFLPEVTALEPLSKSGAPTRALLAERFNQLSAVFANRDAEVKKQSGFIGWFKGLFSGLIKVENKSDVNSPDAILTSAKTKLDGGDLQGAMDEVRRITSPPSEVGVWLNDAQKRLDLEEKIAALRGAIERGMTIQPANQNALNQQLPAANAQAPAPAQVQPKAGEAK